MKFWLTTHWPPRINEDPNNIADGIWLPEGRESAGKDLKQGDRVIVYQARSGRTEIRKRIDGTEFSLPTIEGREGVIAICEVQSEISESLGSEPSKYADGSEIWWRWYAPLVILSKSGFVPRKRMNTVLGYKPNFCLRGFGDFHSGLKEITREQFDSLKEIFKGNIGLLTTKSRIVSKRKTGHRNGDVESIEHFLLKVYVASNPSIVIMENNVQTIGIEYDFPTGDRADILLLDSFGKILGVEIEINVNDKQFEGPLQAIKYRYMSEFITNRRRGDSKAILIAYKISDKMKSLCNRYDIQCIEVNNADVQKWSLSEEGRSALAKQKQKQDWKITNK